MRSAHGVYCNRARERAGTGIFRRVVASCVERSKSRLLPRRPSARIPTKAKLFGPQPPSSFSRFAPSSSFRPPLSYVRVYVCLAYTCARFQMYACTRRHVSRREFANRIPIRASRLHFPCDMEQRFLFFSVGCAHPFSLSGCFPGESDDERRTESGALIHVRAKRLAI